MDDEGSIDAAMWLMIIIQTIGNVDVPGKGPRKMPPPRAYVVVIVGFGILQLLANAGLTRAAKVMAWLTVAGAAVLGPFGTRLVSFLNNVSTNFAISTVPDSNTPTIGSTVNAPGKLANTVGNAIGGVANKVGRTRTKAPVNSSPVNTSGTPAHGGTF